MIRSQHVASQPMSSRCMIWSVKSLKLSKSSSIDANPLQLLGTLTIVHLLHKRMSALLDRLSISPHFTMHVEEVEVICTGGHKTNFLTGFHV